MKTVELLHFIQSELFEVSGDLALSEAEQILRQVLQCSRSDLYLRSKALITKEQQDSIQIIIKHRSLNEPLPYIFNKAYFHSREFYVDRTVLIPRPDTEILVETVLKREKESRCVFLDLCTGSGTIAAILTQERPLWRGIGTDVSFPALRVARKNCGGNISLLNVDMLMAFKPLPYFDFIVCNPPYVSAREMNDLDTSVRNFEPAIALFGGEDGLDFYRIIARLAHKHLKPQGRLYCEIGAGQGSPVDELFTGHAWKDVEIIPDLAGRSRVCACKH